MSKGDGSDQRRVRRVCRFVVCPKCGTEHWEALRADFAVCLVCDWEYHGPIYHPECTEEKPHTSLTPSGAAWKDDRSIMLDALKLCLDAFSRAHNIPTDTLRETLTLGVHPTSQKEIRAVIAAREAIATVCGQNKPDEAVEWMKDQLEGGAE